MEDSFLWEPEKDSTAKLIDSFRYQPNYVSEQIVAVLIERGPVICHELIDALQDSDSNVRYYSLWVLERLGDSRAIQPIYNLLTDADEEIRIFAALALPSFGNIHIEHYKSLLHDKNWQLRSSAAIVLDENKDSQVIEFLLPLLQDENERVRYDTVWALSKFDTDLLNPTTKGNLVVALIYVTKDLNTATRIWATEILGKIGDLRAKEVLTSLRKNDPEISVREAALKALTNF